MPNNNREDEFETLLRAAHDFADLSGPKIMKHFRSAMAVANKAGGASFDPVTKADRAAERAIGAALRSRFPSHSLIGEEFGIRRGRSPFSWVIDPIDGTRAFIMGSPLWGTLVGLLKDGLPYLGLMDHPFTGERIWCDRKASYRRSGGVTRRIRTRACGKLADAILTSTHPDLFEGASRQKALATLKANVRMTRYGGDCYGYGLLAAGHVDLIVESGLKSYDVAALIPIIERAGGRMTTWDGRPASDGGDIVAAGDKRIHAAALDALARD